MTSIPELIAVVIIFLLIGAYFVSQVMGVRRFAHFMVRLPTLLFQKHALNAALRDELRPLELLSEKELASIASFSVNNWRRIHDRELIDRIHAFNHFLRTRYRTSAPGHATVTANASVLSDRIVNTLTRLNADQALGRETSGIR